MATVGGRDQPGVGRPAHRVVGDLTVMRDGRPVLVTPDEAVHDLGDVLAAPVGEPAGPLGDRHVGRVRLILEVVDRHERLSSEGMVAFGTDRAPA